MNFERGRNPLEGESIGFEEANDFEELYELINTIGEVKGTGKDYTAEELIRKIESVRNGHRELDSITRSHGLKDVVERLLKDDPKYKKYLKRLERNE